VIHWLTERGGSRAFQEENWKMENQKSVFVVVHRGVPCAVFTTHYRATKFRQWFVVVNSTDVDYVNIWEIELDPKDHVSAKEPMVDAV
jgi:hypothetical protein